MEPYREDKPYIGIDKDTSLLDRLLEQGMPLMTAIKYIRDNGENIQNLLDMFPGYKGYRKGVQNIMGMLKGEPNKYSASDYARDVGYSTVPFYSAYDNYVNDRPQDWVDNTIDAVSNIPGPAKALGAIPVWLKQLKVAKIVKPHNAEELKQFKEALTIGVKNGEISLNDANKMLANARYDIANEAKIARLEEAGKFDKDYVKQTLSTEPVAREDIHPDDLEYYDQIIAAAHNASTKLKAKPMGYAKQLDNMPVYLQGDAGKLYYNTNAYDANTMRHNLSNYDEISQLGNEIINDKYGKPRPIRLTTGEYKHPYKAVFEPELIKQMPRDELGYQYKKAMNKSYNEGLEELESLKNYVEIQEFLDYMKSLKK